MYQSILSNQFGISGGATENRRENGEALFVARASLNGGVHPGKVHQQFGGSLVSILMFTAVCASAQVAPPPVPTSLPPTVPTSVPNIMALPALPAGFDALNASPEALQSHGLPPKPDQIKDPKAYGAWKTLVTNAKIHVPAKLEQTNIFHKPAQLNGTISKPPAGTKNPISTYNSHWSGPVIYDGNKPFATSYVLGYWTVPFAQQTFGSPDGTWDWSSQWVGIDGWGSDDVFQAGTEVDAYADRGGGTAQLYSFWIEWYPLPETRVGLPVGPGDTVVAEVWNTSPTNGYAFLENLSTGQYSRYTLTAPSGTTLQGTSAEWIVERPFVNGAFARLTNYVADSFTFCWAAGYNYQVLYYPGTDYTPTGAVYLTSMLDNSNNLISYCNLNGLYGIWFFDTGSAY
jgi:hypothetical protein